MAVRNEDDRRGRRAGPAPGASRRLSWRSEYTWLSAAVLVVFGLITSGGALVGIAVGAVFAFVGVRIAFLVFGPYETHRPWLVPIQGLGRLALGLLMAVLGGVAILSAATDMQPSLIWEYPRFGDLRTIFWSDDRFVEMACDHVNAGPPAALAFALERAPQRRFECGANTGSLIDLAAEDETIDTLIRHRQFDQDDLDRKLVSVAWHDRRPVIESLMAAGANPNAVVSGQTALGTAIQNYQLPLAVWLLEHGAQASQTLPNGTTLLDLAKDLDQIEQRDTYAELLLRHGAADPPKLEQVAQAGRR